MNITPLYKGVSTEHVESHSIASLRSFSPKYSLSTNFAVNVESITGPFPPHARGGLKREPTRVVSLICRQFLFMMFLPNAHAFMHQIRVKMISFLQYMPSD